MACLLSDEYSIREFFLPIMKVSSSVLQIASLAPPPNEDASPRGKLVKQASERSDSDSSGIADLDGCRQVSRVFF